MKEKICKRTFARVREAREQEKKEYFTCFPILFLFQFLSKVLTNFLVNVFVFDTITLLALNHGAIMKKNVSFILRLTPFNPFLAAYNTILTLKICPIRSIYRGQGYYHAKIYFTFSRE